MELAKFGEGTYSDRIASTCTNPEAPPSILYSVTHIHPSEEVEKKNNYKHKIAHFLKYKYRPKG